jgi:hypothetical protein
VISFDDNKDSDIHIVFDFSNDSGLAAFSVIISPTYTGDDKSITDLFTDSLQRKLMARMQDPTYVSSIQLALATVQNKQIPSALYLTPESVAFSVYTNSKDGKSGLGCLSIYIKTVDSGFDKGNTSRSFTLPGTANTNSYPIPQSYTASLIIRHDLFAQKFLRDSLASVISANNKKTFKSVSINTDSDTGFSLNCYMDSTGVGNFSSTG